ncbi:hypothetical protein L218DRAFT_947198 [Marasmius fiardii PR-910]|nr:hypothetical protein L218DRAFT_947198 [Marasmius fiardii PR-910]
MLNFCFVALIALCSSTLATGLGLVPAPPVAQSLQQFIFRREVDSVPDRPNMHLGRRNSTVNVPGKSYDLSPSRITGYEPLPIPQDPDVNCIIVHMFDHQRKK